MSRNEAAERLRLAFLGAEVDWQDKTPVQTLDEALATERRLTVDRAFAAMQRVKRSPRKTNAEWQPEDIAFDVGVAAAQDAVRSILREGDDLATADVDEEGRDE